MSDIPSVLVFAERRVSLEEKELLRKIQSAMSRWAKGIPHHTWDPFGEKLHFVNIKEHSIYMASLFVQYGSRGKVKSGMRPYHDEAISPNPTREESVSGVWDYPIQLQEDYSIQDSQFLIPESFRTQVCVQCIGKGETPCEICGSKGTTGCGRCQGKGSISCSACRGKAKIPCPHCHGSGKILSAILPNGKREESACA